MRTIGITGGVGAGKSQVLNIIEDNCKCRVIKADNLAKQLECRGNVCYEPLIELLGRDILDEDEQIVPAKMAQKIFSNKELLDEVNNIIHPAVKTKILDEIDYEEEKKEVDFFFLEAALLIEEGYDLILDELWYVYASENTRRERLKATRGYSDEKINSILGSQLDEETFRRYCSVVIDNNGDMDTTTNQIIELLNDRVEQ